jgi:hypothetical protein
MRIYRESKRQHKMQVLVRPELPTASVGSSQATTAAVDNSASLATRPEFTYKSGKVVQTNGATSTYRGGAGKVHWPVGFLATWLFRLTSMGPDRLSRFIARRIAA